MATINAQITFDPKELSHNILGELNERSQDVLSRRFGLSKEAKRHTLEAIGKKYGITRERVRQIENAAIDSIRKSDAYRSEEAKLEELRTFIKNIGAVVSEEDFLREVSDDPEVQNHVHFHLVLGDHFTKHHEDEHFKSRWSVDQTVSDHVHDSLKELYKKLDTDQLVPETELIEQFLDHVKEVAAEYRDEEILRRWLKMSKKIDRNPLGEWGHAHSTNVRTRGIKDYAYLAMRKHGSPMHFREVADKITELFDKKCHSATCHNELIKDPRFVLVGRGMYALRDWGYSEGVARDIIRNILEKTGPLTKEEIIDRVTKERYFKRNTILVNLHNPQYFTKLADGRYTVAQ